MRGLSLVLIVCALLTSCKNEQPSYDYNKNIIALKKNLERYPDNYNKDDIIEELYQITQHSNIDLNKIDDDSTVQNKIMQKILDKLEQSSVRKLAADGYAEVYRLKIGHAFGGEKIMLTIKKKNNYHQLDVQSFSFKPSCIDETIYKVLDDSCIEVLKNKTIELNENQWSQFITIVKENEYWGLTTKDYHRGHDGSTWSLEAFRYENPALKTNFKNNLHHKIIYRWSPPDYYGIRKIGNYLLQLSEEDWDNDIY